MEKAAMQDRIQAELESLWQAKDPIALACRPLSQEEASKISDQELSRRQNAFGLLKRSVHEQIQQRESVQRQKLQIDSAAENEREKMRRRLAQKELRHETLRIKYRQRVLLLLAGQSYGKAPRGTSFEDWVAMSGEERAQKMAERVGQDSTQTHTKPSADDRSDADISDDSDNPDESSDESDAAETDSDSSDEEFEEPDVPKPQPKEQVKSDAQVPTHPSRVPGQDAHNSKSAVPGAWPPETSPSTAVPLGQAQSSHKTHLHSHNRNDLTLRAAKPKPLLLETNQSEPRPSKIAEPARDVIRDDPRRPRMFDLPKGHPFAGATPIEIPTNPPIRTIYPSSRPAFPSASRSNNVMLAVPCATRKHKAFETPGDGIKASTSDTTPRTVHPPPATVSPVTRLGQVKVAESIPPKKRKIAEMPTEETDAPIKKRRRSSATLSRTGGLQDSQLPKKLSQKSQGNADSERDAQKSSLQKSKARLTSKSIMEVFEDDVLTRILTYAYVPTDALPTVSWLYWSTHQRAGVTQSSFSKGYYLDNAIVNKAWHRRVVDLVYPKTYFAFNDNMKFFEWVTNHFCETLSKYRPSPAYIDHIKRVQVTLHDPHANLLLRAVELLPALKHLLLIFGRGFFEPGPHDPVPKSLLDESWTLDDFQQLVGPKILFGLRGVRDVRARATVLDWRMQTSAEQKTRFKRNIKVFTAALKESAAQPYPQERIFVPMPSMTFDHKMPAASFLFDDNRVQPSAQSIRSLPVLARSVPATSAQQPGQSSANSSASTNSTRPAKALLFDSEIPDDEAEFERFAKMRSRELLQWVKSRKRGVIVLE